MRYFAILLLALASCSFPKDPEDSYRKAEESGLRVGIVHHPPYTCFKDGEAQGSEVMMIEGFAAQEGLEVQYIYGTESELVKQLEEYRLHILAGGFDKKTLWKDKAGLSTTYDGTHCFLVARGENRLMYQLESYLLKEKQHGN